MKRPGKINTMKKTGTMKIVFDCSRIVAAICLAVISLQCKYKPGNTELANRLPELRLPQEWYGFQVANF